MDKGSLNQPEKHEVGAPTKSGTQKRFYYIIIAYPIVLILIAFAMNILLFDSSVHWRVPEKPSVLLLALSAMCLLLNHSWIMTYTELTRLRFSLFATPEEWQASGLKREEASRQGEEELERSHNIHRNSTENSVVYVFLALIFAHVTDDLYALSLWLLMFPFARLGYSFSYMKGRDNWRGLFMSLSLLSMYGMASYLVLGY